METGLSNARDEIPCDKGGVRIVRVPHARVIFSRDSQCIPHTRVIFSRYSPDSVTLVANQTTSLAVTSLNRCDITWLSHRQIGASRGVS